MATAAGADNDAVTGRDACADGRAEAIWRGAGRWTGTGGVKAGAACSTFGPGSTGNGAACSTGGIAGAASSTFGSGAAGNGAACSTGSGSAIGGPAGVGVASTGDDIGANTIAILGSGDGASMTTRCSR